MKLPERITSNPEAYINSELRDEVKESEVGFGAVVVYSNSDLVQPDTLDLRIVLEKNNSNVYGVYFIREKDGQEYIFLGGGTGDLGEFFEVIEHWDIERIYLAILKGWEIMEGELHDTEKLMQNLIKDSQAFPKISENQN